MKTKLGGWLYLMNRYIKHYYLCTLLLCVLMHPNGLGMISCEQKDKFMITEQKYLDAKKIVEQYEQEQLNIPLVISCDDAEYFELIAEKHKIGEENLDMIVREFNNLPRIVEIKKRIKELNISCL